MSPEVCPFCGKTYKRLKSHLPHCKAASPGHEAAGGSAQHQLGHKSSPQNLTGPQSKQSRPASAARSQTAASASPPSAGPASVPKKQKVSEQIKAALVPPPSVSLTSGPKPPRASTSKAKQRTGQGLLAPAKGSRSAPEGPSPAQHVTKPGSGTDASRPASQPRNGGSSKTRVSERQATPAASVIQNFRTQENLAKPRGRETDLATTEREIDDLSVNKGSGSGPPSKMILQDAKALLGRDRNSLKPSRPSLLVPVHSSGPSTASSSLSQAPPATGTPDDQLVGTSSAPASQPALGPAHLSPQVHRALKSLSTASPPLGHFSSTNLPPAAVEALGAPQGPVTDNSRTEGVLEQQRLAQVRLKDLPEWLAWKTPTRPRDLVKMVQKGWHWYYRRYIDVKRGGAGGVGMLLAGYCLLGYIWTYPLIKRDRWRKFH